MNTVNRIPVAPPKYLQSLSHAVYLFAYYESAVINTIEFISPGYIEHELKTGPTAGVIASAFAAALNCNRGLPHKPQLDSIQKRFQRAIRLRNDLLHAHPFTDDHGAQQLGYWGSREGKATAKPKSVQWVPQTQEVIDHAVSEFSAAIFELLAIRDSINPPGV